MKKKQELQNPDLLVYIVLGCIFVLGLVTGLLIGFINTEEVVHNNETIIVYNNTQGHEYNNYTTMKHINQTYNQHKYIDFPLRHTPKCKGEVEKQIGTGISMQPLFEEGDEFYIMLDEYEDFTMHDVVVYSTNKTNITHAVVYKNDNYARTAGYYNTWKDSTRVTPDNYIGRLCER